MEENGGGRDALASILGISRVVHLKTVILTDQISRLETLVLALTPTISFWLKLHVTNMISAQYRQRDKWTVSGHVTLFRDTSTHKLFNVHCFSRGIAISQQAFIVLFENNWILEYIVWDSKMKRVRKWQTEREGEWGEVFLLGSGRWACPFSLLSHSAICRSVRW